MSKLAFGTFAFIALVVLTGCGKSTTNLAAQPQPPPGGGTPPPFCVGSGCLPPPPGQPTPTPPPAGNGPIPAPSPMDQGANVILTPVSFDRVRDYAAGNPLNQIGPIMVTIATSPVGKPRVWLGSIHIRYYDNQNGSLVLHNGNFSNGGTTGDGNNVHIHTINGAGVETWRIMFEDQWGAIDLILHPETGTDIGPSLHGIVWYRNFNTNAPNPLYQGYCDMSYGFPQCFNQNPKAFCWSGQITIGPYDCRIPNGWMVDPNKFTKLGEMSGINASQALGI